MIHSHSKPSKHLPTATSVTKSASFIHYGDTSKRKRHRSSYKDLYLDKVNFVPIDAPFLSQRRDSGYSMFYQNSSFNISQVEDNGIVPLQETRSTINLNVNLGKCEIPLSRVKSISYVNPKNNKKKLRRVQTISPSKTKYKGSSFMGSSPKLKKGNDYYILGDIDKEHNDSSTTEQDGRFQNVKSVGILKTKYNSSTLSNLVLGRKYILTEDKEDSYINENNMKSKFFNSTKKLDSIEGTLIDNNEKDYDDFNEIRNRLEGGTMNNDSDGDITPINFRKEKINGRGNKEVLFENKEFDLSPINSKLTDNKENKGTKEDFILENSNEDIKRNLNEGNLENEINKRKNSTQKSLKSSHQTLLKNVNSKGQKTPNNQKENEEGKSLNNSKITKSNKSLKSQSSIKKLNKTKEGENKDGKSKNINSNTNKTLTKVNLSKDNLSKSQRSLKKGDSNNGGKNKVINNKQDSNKGKEPQALKAKNKIIQEKNESNNNTDKKVTNQTDNGLLNKEGCSKENDLQGNNNQNTKDSQLAELANVLLSDKNGSLSNKDDIIVISDSKENGKDSKKTIHQKQFTKLSKLINDEEEEYEVEEDDEGGYLSYEEEIKEVDEENEDSFRTTKTKGLSNHTSKGTFNHKKILRKKQNKRSNSEVPENVNLEEDGSSNNTNPIKGKRRRVKSRTAMPKDIKEINSSLDNKDSTSKNENQDSNKKNSLNKENKNNTIHNDNNNTLQNENINNTKTQTQNNNNNQLLSKEEITGNNNLHNQKKENHLISKSEACFNSEDINNPLYKLKTIITEEKPNYITIGLKQRVPPLQMDSLSNSNIDFEPLKSENSNSRRGFNSFAKRLYSKNRTFTNPNNESKDINSDSYRAEIDDFINKIKEKNRTKEEQLSQLKNQKEEELKHLRQKTELLQKQREEAKQRRSVLFSFNTADKSKASNKDLHKNSILSASKAKLFDDFSFDITYKPFSTEVKEDVKKEYSFFDINKYHDIKKNYTTSKEKSKFGKYKVDNYPQQKNIYLNKVKEDMKTISIKKKSPRDKYWNLFNSNIQRQKVEGNFVMPANSLDDVLESKDNYIFTKNNI